MGTVYKLRHALRGSGRNVTVCDGDFRGAGECNVRITSHDKIKNLFIFTCNMKKFRHDDCTKWKSDSQANVIYMLIIRNYKFY